MRKFSFYMSNKSNFSPSLVLPNFCQSKKNYPIEPIIIQKIPALAIVGNNIPTTRKTEPINSKISIEKIQPRTPNNNYNISNYNNRIDIPIHSEAYKCIIPKIGTNKNYSDKKMLSASNGENYINTIILENNSNPSNIILPPKLKIPVGAYKPKVNDPLPKIDKFTTTYINSDNINKQTENPWLYFNPDASSEIKIVGQTPIGTIAAVPTSSNRPTTPKRLIRPKQYMTLRIVDQNGFDINNDPILDATIYLDCTRTEDQKYDHVSNKMKSITHNILSLQKQYTNQLKPLINISGVVSIENFEIALAIYENNQVFYQDCLDNSSLNIDDIKIQLTNLEHWFMAIIEPKPKLIIEIDEWRKRELFKLTNGYSSYCDPLLLSYISPPSNELKQFIAKHQNF